MTLAVALQEWSLVCDLLDAGSLILAVRKGGIHERHGGLFVPEHERFALLPTHLHQDPARLRPGLAAPASSGPAPGMHRVAIWAETTRVWRVTDRARLDAVGSELPWNTSELDVRFAYRGQPFLFVLALRVHRLPTPLTIPDHPSYAGCRSWIPLREPLAIAGSVPVLDDTAWQARLAPLAAALDTAP